jgi:hypothetical protein
MAPTRKRIAIDARAIEAAFIGGGLWTNQGIVTMFFVLQFSEEFSVKRSGRRGICFQYRSNQQRGKGTALCPIRHTTHCTAQALQRAASSSSHCARRSDYPIRTSGLNRFSMLDSHSQAIDTSWPLLWLWARHSRPVL